MQVPSTTRTGSPHGWRSKIRDLVLIRALEQDRQMNSSRPILGEYRISYCMESSLPLLCWGGFITSWSRWRRWGGFYPWPPWRWRPCRWRRQRLRESPWWCNLRHCYRPDVQSIVYSLSLTLTMRISSQAHATAYAYDVGHTCMCIRAN